jgi:hypothetical protein
LHYSSGDIAAGLLSGKKCRQSSKGGIPMRLIALAALAGLLVAPAIADPEGQYSGVCESAMRLQLAATCSGCDLPGGNRHLRLYHQEGRSVSDITVRESSGNAALDGATKAYATQWHYVPALKNGEPIEIHWATRIRSASKECHASSRAARLHCTLCPLPYFATVPFSRSRCWPTRWRVAKRALTG